VTDTDPRSTIAHLLRRTGFGPTATEVDAALARGYAATVDQLLDFSTPDPADASPLPTFAPYEGAGAKNLTVAQRQAIQKQRTLDVTSLIDWWLVRMATTAHPLREKLSWFWHGHFATSVQKVQRATYMATQNQIFRSMGAGNFEALTQVVAKDPAMLIWLDAASDVKAHPNENFAREAMELFTLGIGNYTENDVKEAARAFTGWHIDRTSQAWAMNTRQHDGLSKTVLGQTGPWSGEDVVHILTTSDASARWITSRLWSHFAYPVLPGDPVVQELAPGYGADHDIKSLLRSILLHPEFVSDTARAGLVKQPIEWTVGVFRALNLPTVGKRILPVLRQLGQVPLDPPNVGGWPQNEYWLTTASSLTRLRVAVAAATAAKVGATLPADVAHLLSVGSWSDATNKALQQAAAQPKVMLALALVSPDYTLA
jgi:uncharacterized protein (DUF1800 family)